MDNNYLMHFGIKGMRWGVRRYQNKDGSLTPAGKKRYSDKEISEYRKKKIAEAPTKSESPRGANKGWYKNAPKSTLIREMRREESESLKAKKKTNTKNYSEQQRIRDRKLYGERAVQRINKRMLNGEGIQSARHNEVVRKERISSGKQIAKNVAKGALVIGGAAAVTTVLQKKGIGDKIAQGIMTEQIVNVGRSFINGIFK